MEEKTLEALKGSIEKWKEILSGEGHDNGTENCPLCKLFNKMSSHEDCCKGCPISKSVENLGCNSTPYDKWMIHQEECHFEENDYNGIRGKVWCSECRKLAKAELEFLESLQKDTK